VAARNSGRYIIVNGALVVRRACSAFPAKTARCSVWDDREPLDVREILEWAD
jgi:hypothetical protein